MKVYEKVIAALAGVVVTGGLAWGLYMQGRVDLAHAKSAEQAVVLKGQDKDLEYIKKAVDRIEAKLERVKK